MSDLQNRLFLMQDINYKEFSSNLMPTVPKEKVIGIRTPILRKFAKSFAKTDDAQIFLKELPHKYYEQNNLHAFIVEEINDFDNALARTDEFLPYIDNWATCDSFMPKIFKNNKEKLLKKIKIWIKSDYTYVVRYAIGLLMKLYLDDDFKVEYLALVASVKSDEYYINMMRAWYFATALAKQYDASVEYLKNNMLDVWTHNKTIQKACESYRINDETKIYLKNFKRHNKA